MDFNTIIMVTLLLSGIYGIATCDGSASCTVSSWGVLVFGAFGLLRQAMGLNKKPIKE